MRKFFRIRGKSGFMLDEVIAPVALVQDLTKGPYQAGITPAMGTLQVISDVAGLFTLALILNDKAGSLSANLGKQFDDRSFSVSNAEMQNVGADSMTDMRVRLVPRSAVVAFGVPISSAKLVSIQDNDGSLTVPVEMFGFNGTLAGVDIWRGILGDNLNTVGSLRTVDAVPAITIGPKDALIITDATGPGAVVNIRFNIRGFFQQQPA